MNSDEERRECSVCKQTYSINEYGVRKNKKPFKCCINCRERGRKGNREYRRKRGL